MKKNKILASVVVMAGLIISFSQAKDASAAEGKKKKAGLEEQFTGQGYGTSGCGLGSVIFGEKPGLVQIFAGTTNQLYSNQSFGISSGTSNCAEDYSDRMQSASLFIRANRASLKKDISRGSGETVAHLSKILGCEDSSAFGSSLQKNFGTIFPSEAVQDQQVTDSIVKAVSNCKLAV